LDVAFVRSGQIAEDGEGLGAVPAFVTPYANADEANHAPNENLEVERFYKGIKSGVAVLAELGAMRG
jgi:hypothetical protein